MMNENDKNTGQGTLYLCATPIGNLEDITLRVLQTLKDVDLIAAEDTRNTLKLLNHFDIHTPMTSYHEYNKIAKGRELVEKYKIQLDYYGEALERIMGQKVSEKYVYSVDLQKAILVV